MPNFTPNLNLKKPLTTEYYNIADFNDNMDILDVNIPVLPREQYIEDITTSFSTSSTSFVTFVTFTSQYAGTFMVFSNTEYAPSNVNARIEARIVLNDSTELCKFGYNGQTPGQYYPLISVRKINLNIGDTIKIQGRTFTGSDPILMRNGTVYIKEYKGS